MRIDDYAIIGNLRTAALVSRSGSVDWLCLPRFDSPACFAALLGTPDNGRWLIQPDAEFTVERRYRGDSLVLETDFTCAGGKVRLVDSMLPLRGHAAVVRIVRGLSGRVPMKMELLLRMDYGSIIPWVTRLPFGGIKAVAGPDTIRLKTSVPTTGRNYTTHAAFEIHEGERLPFVLSWAPSHEPAPPEIENPADAVEEAALWWMNWAGRSNYQGRYEEAVTRSLITLKALTYQPTGGMVAAATTSLPEQLGGVRNWDYRYCWLRDATETLSALLLAGYNNEALRWRDWLLRSVAGHPTDIRIMYSLEGGKRLTELELPWLAGFAGSQPVRIGNAACEQRQLDVFGGIMRTFQLSRESGLEHDDVAWSVQQKLLGLIEQIWREPDHGMWEVRGPMQHFTYSKVKAWQALHNAVQGVAKHSLAGDAARWSKVAAEIHQDVCEKGFDAQRGTFTQAYGSPNLDASLLLIPSTGFLPATDPRMAGTVRAVQQRLMHHGLLLRYDSGETNDGLPENEGAFIACTFWLADNLILQGRVEEGRALFERLLELRNDVGLLSEEYDPVRKNMLGNFPQAFSHLSLLHTAFLLSETTRAPERLQ